MKHSIYFRNFIAMTLVVLTSFVVLGGLSLTYSYRRALGEKREDMTVTLREAVRYISAQSHHEDFDLHDLNISMWLSMISGVSGFELLLTDTSGVIASCSERELFRLGMTVPNHAVTHTAQGGGVMITNLGGIYTSPRQVAGAPLTMMHHGERVVFGYLFLSGDSDAFRQHWRGYSGMFLFMTMCVMLVMFVISFVMTKKQAEPINEMASAARRFARGDFTARVEDIGRLDEIGELTAAFNAMADSLESHETHRRDFIANISHELKTPMTVIAGFADGILDGTIPPENAGRYIGVISSETRRLSRLVNSMLDMAQIQAADSSEILKGRFDLAEVVRLALLGLDSKIDAKGLSVFARLPEEPVVTRGDRDAITQVAYNLIDNAIKFSPPGEEVRIELWKQGVKAFVSVQNRGEEIPPGELPHIFERFHKTDKSRSRGEGVGLGLYIVKSILDNHNEDVFLSSRDGATKIVFTLTIG